MIGGGHRGGGQVPGQSPPQRGGGLLVGQRSGAGGGAGEGGDVDTGAVDGGQPLGQRGPVGVIGDARVDAVCQRCPRSGGGVRVTEQAGDALVEDTLGAGLGG